MKKINLLIAAGLLCTVSMQAQKRVVASLGFEDGDAKYTTPYSLTALEQRPVHWDDNNKNQNGKNLGFIHGDWVNYKSTDQWTEKCTDDPHSGDYCFQAVNGGVQMGNTWDRGFKIGLDGVQELTPYRVSFWVKADPETTYSVKANGETVDETTEATKLTSWFSQGTEELDKSIPNYGFDQCKELLSGKTMTLNGEWQRVVYQVFVCPKSDIDATRQSWQGNSEFPAAYGGNGESYWDHFQQHFPDLYFFIANMFCNGTYYLDDILVEENVTVKEVTYSEEIIKVDFGYATNLADLANGNGGTMSFDPSSVTVTQDGDEVPVLYVEGKSDGFLYIFVDGQLFDDSEVIVSFKGNDKLIYSDASKRPTAETGDVAVFGFEDEKAYWDEEVYAVALAYGQPSMKKSVPVNNSFNLLPEDVKEVAITYTSKVQITKDSKAELKHGTSTTDLTAGMKLSSDALTVTVPVSGLENGAYTLVVTGLKNQAGTDVSKDAEVVFEIGEADGDGDVDVVYQSDLDIAGSNVPYGFSGFAKGTWNKSTREAPYSGQGSAPRVMSSTGKGIYMCARPEGNKVSLEFGKYAAVEAAEHDGVITNLYDAETNPTGIDPATEALYLEPGDYILDFVMPAWDTSRTAKTFKSGIYSVKVDYNQEDSEADPYIDVPVEGAVWDEPAPKSVIGTQGVFNTGDLTSEDATTHEFTITEPGYYYVKFSGTDLGYEAWLLVSLTVSSKPESIAAYYLQMLKKAKEGATETLESAPAEYKGASKPALAAVIDEASKGKYTNPQEVEEIVKKLDDANGAMKECVTNLNKWEENLADALSKYAELEGKYKNSKYGKDAEALLAEYGEKNAADLSDEDLNAASAQLKNTPALLSNVKSVVDLIMYRATLASKLANNFGAIDVVETLDELGIDDLSVLAVANANTTIAVYEFLGEGGEIPEDWKEVTIGDEDPNYDEEDEEQRATHDEYGHWKTVLGVDFTGYIKNPNFYTYATDFSRVDNNTLPGWTFEPISKYDEETGAVVSTGSAKLANGWNGGNPATAENPVVTAALNPYGGSAEYKFYQEIKNLPVGKYNFVLGSRTATNTYTPEGETEAIIETFNAQNEETGIWDKYIFIKVGDAEPIMVPFSAGGTNFEGIETIIKDVVIDKEGQTVTIGAVENYTSGKAVKNGQSLTAWDTNTYVKNAKIYFTAPLEGYDYKAALQTLKDHIATGIEAVDAAPAQKTDVIYNLAGQQVDENYKGIVIKNGVKYLQK